MTKHKHRLKKQNVVPWHAPDEYLRVCKCGATNLSEVEEQEARG